MIRVSKKDVTLKSHVFSVTFFLEKSQSVKKKLPNTLSSAQHLERSERGEFDGRMKSREDNWLDESPEDEEAMKLFLSMALPHVLDEADGVARQPFAPRSQISEWKPAVGGIRCMQRVVDAWREPPPRCDYADDDDDAALSAFLGGALPLELSTTAAMHVLIQDLARAQRQAVATADAAEAARNDRSKDAVARRMEDVMRSAQTKNV